MIRPLRQRHRRIFIALGILLPLAFGLGIAARKAVPKMSAFPASGATNEAGAVAKPVAPTVPNKL